MMHPANAVSSLHFILDYRFKNRLAWLSMKTTLAIKPFFSKHVIYKNKENKITHGLFSARASTFLRRTCRLFENTLVINRAP